MLRKTLLALSASAALGAAALAPNIALALPLGHLFLLGHGGPLPLLGHGGAFLGHGRLLPLPGHGGSPPFLGQGDPAGHLGFRGPVGQFGQEGAVGFRGGDRGLQGHSARYGYGYGNSYGHSRYTSSYGHSGSRHRDWGRYGDGPLEGGGGYASGDDGCYYANTYGSGGRYRRTAGCSDD